MSRGREALYNTESSVNMMVITLIGHREYEMLIYIERAR